VVEVPFCYKHNTPKAFNNKAEGRAQRAPSGKGYDHQEPCKGSTKPVQPTLKRLFQICTVQLIDRLSLNPVRGSARLG